MTGKTIAVVVVVVALVGVIAYMALSRPMAGDATVGGGPATGAAGTGGTDWASVVTGIGGGATAVAAGIAEAAAGSGGGGSHQ